jgi:copper(I)-binding protein
VFHDLKFAIESQDEIAVTGKFQEIWT